MLISVIIPTYKREKDLSECLDSILSQSFLPTEVFVIDNARESITKESIFAKKELFYTKGIKIEYIDNKENSLTVARNLGVKLCSGEVISFLDDDVVLDVNYYKEIHKFFKENYNALGVCAQTIGNLYETNKLKFIIAQTLGKVFFIGFNEKNKCRVLPSLGVTASMSPNIVSCEWISGASSYRRKVFSEFSFDEKLKKYSWDEDLDFSYRVNKKYPATLFLNPKIKYLHKLSESGRSKGKELAYMEEIYTLYLFFKLIPQNLTNGMIYAWSRIGTLVYKFLKFRFLDIYLSFCGMVISIIHIKSIRMGNLDFFNKTLK